MKKDEAIYQYVVAHPKTNDRSVEKIAALLGVDPYDVRVIVHKSSRLAMRGVLLGWHVVELVKGEDNGDIEAEGVCSHGPGSSAGVGQSGRESCAQEGRGASVDNAGS